VIPFSPAKADRGSSEDKLEAIELVRFLAAFAVILWHYKYYFAGPASGEMPHAAIPLWRLLSFFYSFGSVAVEWFWVVSGFVFFFSYSDTLRGGAVTGFEFFCRRFARLYPLHILTLLLVSGLLFWYRLLFGIPFPHYAADSTLWTFLSQVPMASNWLNTHYSFNGPVWSVSVEVLVYFLFFCLTKYGHVVGLAGTLIVAFTCMMLFHLTRNSGTLSWITECAACFYLGGSACEIQKRYPAASFARAWMFLRPALVAAGFASWWIVPEYAHRFFIPAIAILILVSLDFIKRSNLVAGMARLGNWTYASYLLHFPVALLSVIVMRLLQLDATAIARSSAFLLMYVVLVFLLADICYTFYEAPARKMLRRLGPAKYRIPALQERQAAID
jgi:peptidoglycan/LPS O-acetylase OafA/YrhL